MEIVSIIGPIGAGKSTFVKNLKPYQQFDMYYHEDVSGNKYLAGPPTIDNQIKCQEYIINHKKEFYKQFVDNYQNIKVLEDASLYQDLFYVYKNLYYQDKTVFDNIVNQYLTLIEQIYKKADKHTIIFIDLDVEQNLINVKKRGRSFEQELDLAFFKEQKAVLLEILEAFDGAFEIKYYQPKLEMFTLDENNLAQAYHQVYQQLELI